MHLNAKTRFLNYCSGFTLLELMVTIAMLAIISALAVPNLSQFLQNREMQGQSAAMSDVMSTARAMALSRGADINVCWNNTDSDATFVGNIITIAPKDMVIVDTSVSDNVARRFQYESNNLLVDDDIVSPAETCITFDSQGRADITPNFLVCRSKGDDSRALTVSILRGGRTTIIEGNPQNLSCD